MAEAGHSPLGFSGASRWMVCPGSVTLSQGCHDEEADYTTLGKAAHALGAMGLGTGYDAWMALGTKIVERPGGQNPLFCPPGSAGYKDAPGVEVDKDMAVAVQVYLDFIRKKFPDRNQGNTWIEKPFHCPTIHELCFGTSDFTHYQRKARQLDVVDYKHGAGIIVEVDDNPQLKGYACGMLEELRLWEHVDKVVLWIVQPRGWHGEGPVRRWEIATAELIAWLEDELIPAMNRAMVSRETKSGEHCRFCPARSYACPQILSDLEELVAMEAKISKEGAGPLTGEQVARFLDLHAVFKIAASAASKTGFQRLQAGHAVPGYKLAHARGNRIWKDGAEAAIKAKFGAEAMLPEKLKSPAQIEELPQGEAMTARYAEKPTTALTLVPIKDKRAEVSRDTKSLFKPVKKGVAA